MTSFKILSSVHSWKDVELGEENVKYLSKRPYTWNSNGSRCVLMPSMAGELWVQREQTVTTVWKCVHQSQGAIIFSSTWAGTESGHSWFLYESCRGHNTEAEQRHFIQQPYAPWWILHSSWCCSFTIHGNHYNVHNKRFSQQQQQQQKAGE